MAETLGKGQDLERVAVKQLVGALSKVQNGTALGWTRLTTSIGQVVNTRVLWKLDTWTGSRVAWPKWSFVMTRRGSQAAVRIRVGCRERYGRGDQCTASKCAVAFRPGRVAHGKRLESHRKCSTRLEYEGVATSLSDVFPDERCKVDDDGGTGSFVRHERYDGRGCLGDFTRRCFREFWKEWYFEKQRTSECRKMQKDHDM